MAVRSEPVAPPTGLITASAIDWAAIIAGAVVASALGVLFSTFGAALGLSTISPLEGEGDGTLAMILSGAWMLITVIVAYWTGGYIAGRMRRRVEATRADETQVRDSVHGAVVWAIGLLLSAWIAASAIGTAVTAAGQAAGGVAQAAGAIAEGAATAAGGVMQAAAGDDGDGGLLTGFDPVQAIGNRLLRGTGEQVNPDARLSAGARDVIFNIVRTGELADDDRRFLAAEISRNTTMTPAEADARINAAVTEATRLRDEAAAALQEAEDTARAAADKARRTAVLTGFALTAALLIAAGAAMWGSVAGGRHRDEGRLVSFLRAY